MLEIQFQLPTASVYLSGQIKTYRCILLKRTTKESKKGFLTDGIKPQHMEEWFVKNLPEPSHKLNQNITWNAMIS